jgi:hypothetical protein
MKKILMNNGVIKSINLIKTKMDSKIFNRRTLSIIVLIISVTLISCSDKVFSGYSRSEDAAYSRQKINGSRNADQSIPSPYTDEYRTKLKENYFRQ